MGSRRYSCAVALALLASCTRDRPTQASPGKSSPKETRVIEIKSSTDLEKLSGVYLERISAGFSGTLEIHVAPGTYDEANWDMAPAAQGGPVPPIDVVIEGSGAVIPGPNSLVARSIRMTGLVFVKQRLGTSVLEATSSVAITHCAFINGRMTNPQVPRPYVEIRSRGIGGKKTPVEATIDDTWFVRNFQAGGNEGSSVIAFTTDDHEPAYFKAVTIRNSAFLGNAFMTDVAIAYAKTATIEHSLFYKTWGSGVLISSVTSGDVVVKDSVLVIDDVARVATVDHSPPVQLVGSKVYAKTLGTSPALKAGADAFAPRSALDKTIKDVDDAIATLPVAMPPDELRAKVDKALRP
jgi:hypothetical protein